MNNTSSKIFVIDDDEAVRRSISLLLKSAGYVVESYKDADEFLATGSCNDPGCILLDVFLDGKLGLELHTEIINKFPHLPIIYMTGFGNIPMSVEAMKKGAINFLQKPVDDRQLMAAVEEALDKSCDMLAHNLQANRAQTLIDTLTPREFEIFRLIITGLLNKQIAAKLNIAEQTVKIHRGRITEKLGVKSVAEMVYMAEKLDIR